MNSIDEIKNYLKENLSSERYFHTLGVMQEAIELAKRYNADIKKAEIAGLLHDNAKCMTKEDLRKFISENLPDLDKNELKNYKTLHAPVGAYFAKEKFKISDPEIISAIRWHTLGRVNMTLLEKIVFLADKIEKNTRDIEYRNQIIKILDENEGELGLNKALFRCFIETVKSLAERKLYICTTTIDVYNWLLEITEN
ncbi:TPA: bis(5'-nucleosyl)-tetraphosphatase (symmetrical) YqeK [Candidatus Galligastranaerophilus intestinigallinarum]|nr:bis(5'-nucleosyl)-tetraphosphatase (symmetrical) YqeK [Candidatus Galligastranaerophilus intestinigallinarum]